VGSLGELVDWVLARARPAPALVTEESEAGRGL
jgi:hypothetical protein